MTKLIEYYDLADSDRTDPLMLVVRNLKNEQKRLSELKSQSQGYLVPIDKKGKIEVGFDPDRSEEIHKLAMDIEASRTSIKRIEDKIASLDAILEKHKIELPLLVKLHEDLGLNRRNLKEDQAKIDAILANLMIVRPDEAKAKQNPDYIRYAKIAKESDAMRVPLIVKLQKVIEEIEVILNATESEAKDR